MIPMSAIKRSVIRYVMFPIVGQVDVIHPLYKTNFKVNLGPGLLYIGDAPQTCEITDIILTDS